MKCPKGSNPRRVMILRTVNISDTEIISGLEDAVGREAIPSVEQSFSGGTSGKAANSLREIHLPGGGAIPGDDSQKGCKPMKAGFS